MKFHKGQGRSSLYVETAKHNSSSMPVQEYVQPKMLIEWAGVTGIGHGSNSQERVKREKINGEAYFSLASPHLGKIKMTNQQKNVHGFKNLALKSTRFSFSGIFFAFGLRFRISWMALLAITCQIAQNENIVCNYPTLAFKIGILGQNKTEPLLYPKCHWCGKGGSCRSFPVFWMSLWHPPQISVGSIQIKLSMWHVLFLAHSFSKLPETSV